MAMTMNNGKHQIGSERCWQRVMSWFVAAVDEPRNQSQFDLLEHKTSKSDSQYYSKLIDSVL